MTRLLLCDENQTNWHRLREMLASEAVAHQLDWSDSRAKAEEGIAVAKHHAYLIHGEIGMGQGLDMIRDLTWQGRRQPVFLLLETADAESESAGLAAGAAGVLILDDLNPSSLERSLRHGMERMRSARATGWWGEEHLMVDEGALTDRVDLAILRARRTQRSFAMVTLGYETAREHRDVVERRAGMFYGTLTERIRACIPEGCTIGRVRNRELVVLVEELFDAQAAAEQGSQILIAASTPLSIGGKEVQLSTRIGMSVYPDHGHTPDLLMAASREAMHQARTASRSQMRFHAGEKAPVTRRAMVQRALATALKGDELRLHYQPQVDVTRMRTVGAEALLRWESPTLGSVSPGEFVPILEESGMIHEFGEWVLRESCRQARTWMDLGLDLRVGVNVSAHQFHRGDLSEIVRSALHDSDLPPTRLELEITEGLLLDNTRSTLELLRGFREQGIKIAVDDFGTGYASLSYVKRFPMDVIKIDREFVRNLPLDNENAAITSSIVALARSLGKDVIAEGVETEAEQEFLRALSCNIIQGYLHARPMAPPDFLSWMSSRPRDSRPPPNLERDAA